jgi:hypothetical protein
MRTSSEVVASSGEEPSVTGPPSVVDTTSPEATPSRPVCASITGAPSVAPSPPGAPASDVVVGWHWPIASVAELQGYASGQTLPPVPRQPGTQRAGVASQTRPEWVAPQSVSLAQPQVPPAVQRAPPRSARHASAWPGAHSTQARVVASHTRPAPQSPSTRHCTQRPPATEVSQWPSGAAQPPSLAHAIASPPQRPTAFVVLVHAAPVGQPSPARPSHPGTQKPPALPHTRPTFVPQAPPAVASQPQIPRSTTQVGLSPWQAAALVAEHSVHAPASGPVRRQMGRDGSEQDGAPSEVQPMQACVVGEQKGVTPPQSPSPRQPTHVPPPAAVSHRGAEGGQREVSVGMHVAQTPLPRHSGAALPHSAPDAQPRHDDVAGSQTGVAPVHAEVAPARHSTQVPAVEHTGAAAGQSAAATQGRHVCVVASQTGVVPEQSAAERQPTQVPAPVSQSGVAPAHAPWIVAEHWPQAPPGWQAGVEPPQSLSTSQTRQLCAVRSQTGFAAGHCASVKHETQSPDATSQTAVGSAQAVAFDVEHWPHAPLGWQAGAALPHWASAAQPWQVCAVGSQTGAIAPHWALVLQLSQMPRVVLHVEVGPVQAPLFVAEQTPQAPFGSQAGVAPPHWASLAHPTHAWVARSHTGVAPRHWALLVHGTQRPVAASHAGVVPPQREALVAEQAPQAPLGSHAGVAPPHWVSLVHARQTWTATSQTGVTPPQSALDAQPTHTPAATLQLGVVPRQWDMLVAEHWPQAPLGSQAGRAPPQSVSLPHATQVCVTRSQTGAVPPHWAADVQPTHTPAVASQAGRLVAAHFVKLEAEHWPHAPFGSQAGAEAGHSASLAQARQVRVAPQTGVVPTHCELEVHATHVPVETLHAGVAPTQSERLDAEHWPQTPVGWQAGVAPPHGASLVQPRHVCVAGSQTGATAPQSALPRQATHTPLVVSHSGVPPVQRIMFVAEHCVQAPLAKQAGVAPPHSASPPQARQVLVASSQMGVVAPQVPFDVQGTQVPLPILQAGVAPVQRVALLAAHWPHAPVTSQAGVAPPPHSASPPQARQVLVAASHTGVVLPHCAFETQGTQAPATTSQTGVAPPQRVAFAAEHWPHAPPG